MKRKVNLNNPREIWIVGNNALNEALGPIGAVRFIQQYDLGHGDYTKERNLKSDITMDEFNELYKKLFTDTSK